MWDRNYWLNCMGLQDYELWSPINPFTRLTIDFLNAFGMFALIYSGILVVTILYYNKAVFEYRRPELMVFAISILSIITDFIFPAENILITFLVFTFYLVPIALLPISMDYIVSEYESGAYMMCIALLGFMYGTVQGHNFCMHIAYLTGLSSAALALRFGPHLNIVFKYALVVLVAIIHFGYA